MGFSLDADLPELSLKIPDEYKPVAAIGIGSFMPVFLAVFRGWGLQRILHRNKRGELRLRSGRPSLFAASLLFGWAVFLMMVLHLVEVVIWAVVLVYLGLVPRIPNAMYFCANAYTTLGMGSLDLGEHWHILSPIIAMSGLFTFAWTTSSLVDVVSTHTRLLEQLELERERQLKMRMAASEEALKTIGEERAAEKDLRRQAYRGSATPGLFNRLRARRSEEKHLEALRAEAKKNIAEIRSEERSEEEKLAQSGPDDATSS